MLEKLKDCVCRSMGICGWNGKRSQRRLEGRQRAYNEESGRLGSRAKICPHSHREMVPGSKQKMCTARLAHRRDPKCTGEKGR